MGARLVRDHVEWDAARFPDMLKLGLRPVASPAEFDRLLIQKLFEEAGELTAATSHREMLEECADIYEVLASMVERVGLYREDILKVAAEKRSRRGGFQEGLVWEV